MAMMYDVLNELVDTLILLPSILFKTFPIFISEINLFVEGLVY